MSTQLCDFIRPTNNKKKNIRNLNPNTKVSHYKCVCICREDIAKAGS